MTSDEMLIAALILSPLATAVLLTAVSRPIWRAALVWSGAGLAAILSLATVWAFIDRPPVDIVVRTGWLRQAVFIAGIAVTGLLLLMCRGLRARDAWIPLALALQLAMIVWAETGVDMKADVLALRVNHLGLVMVLIIGLVGSVICIHALGYMADWHAHHADIPDRRRSFFFLLFAFLSSMFGLVLANDLVWLHVWWEATTLACFLLIRYAGTDEARASAVRALGFNAVGGLGLAGAMVYQTWMADVPTLEIHRMVAQGAGSVAVIPALLIAFAGLTKAAQLPASPWLLGAMVAPTPVSALLHSSTMVKAGVYVLIRFSPVFHGHPAGVLVSLIGGVTFLVTAFAAVTQSNAKRALAYSTMSNLGLIVACAGIGSPEAVWAAMLLLVFHAVAKGLLFIAVGTIEHRTGSRDIEDMDGLVVRWPALGIVVLTGIMGMFLAPFGMLLAKWTAIKAMVDANPVLAILVAFGSAPTLFLWTKWMGRITTVPGGAKRESGGASVHEWTALGALAAITVAAVALFPLVSSRLVNPHLVRLYGPAAAVGVPVVLIAIMGVMLAAFALVSVGILFVPVPAAPAPRYLSGLNLPGPGVFQGALGAVRPVVTRNSYLADLLPERSLMLGGGAAASLLIAASLGGLLW